MTDTREAAIERVRAYVEAWIGYKDSAVACMRSDSPLILGDLRLLLTDRQPSEAMRGTAQTALKWNMAKGQIEPPVTADEGWRPIESAPRDGTAVLGWNKAWGARETRMKFYQMGSPGYALWEAGGGPAESGWEWEEQQNNWIASWSPTHWRPLPAPPTGEGGGL